MRSTISIVASAALWMILPLALEFQSGGTRSSYGWSMFWAELPLYLFRWFGVFLAVAAVMHWVFARIILQLGRLSFFIFPLLSLLCASVVFWMVWCGVIRHVSWDELIYSLFGVLAVVFFKMIWLTYPLALVNQWLIREILDESISPPGRLVRSHGFGDRLVDFLKSRI